MVNNGLKINSKCPCPNLLCENHGKCIVCKQKHHTPIPKEILNKFTPQQLEAYKKTKNMTYCERMNKGVN